MGREYLCCHSDLVIILIHLPFPGLGPCLLCLQVSGRVLTGVLGGPYPPALPGPGSLSALPAGQWPGTHWGAGRSGLPAHWGSRGFPSQNGVHLRLRILLQVSLSFLTLFFLLSRVLYIFLKSVISVVSLDNSTVLPLDFLFFFFFLQLHLQHMEVPRLGVEFELQLPAYTKATAAPALGRICNLHCSLPDPYSSERGRGSNLHAHGY